MTGRDYRFVAARIRQELPELDRVARRAWASASRDSDDLYLDSAALNVHGFYVGLERIFTVVAERIDCSLPSGPNWHRDLLRQMTAEVPGVRAAIVSTDLYPTLDRYRGFRHVVRNVYAYVMDPRLMAILVEDLPAADERLRAQLAAFADMLEAIAEAAGD